MKQLTKNELIDRSEHYALGQVFHSYPEQLTYEEIKELLSNAADWQAWNDQREAREDDDNALCVCEANEDYSGEYLIELLNDLQSSYFNSMKDMIVEEKA